MPARPRHNGSVTVVNGAVEGREEEEEEEGFDLDPIFVSTTSSSTSTMEHRPWIH